jgi:uncharacterized protein (TIGR00159 family)
MAANAAGPATRHPKTGERRRPRRPLQLDCLPLAMLDRIRAERAAGRSGAEIEQSSPQWPQWEQAGPEALACFPDRRLPHRSLQRWHDLRVEQVRHEQQKQSLAAHAIAEQLAAHGFSGLDDAVKNARPTTSRQPPPAPACGDENFEKCALGPRPKQCPFPRAGFAGRSRVRLPRSGDSDRWQWLASLGARAQRLLLASAGIAAPSFGVSWLRRWSGNIVMLPVVRWQIFADFLVLTVAFYALLRWARSARAMRIALGVVGLHALALLARRLDLVVTSWVLDASAILTILVLLLIFQPELRRAFMRLDSTLKPWPRPAVAGIQTDQAIANAAFGLARCHLGALLVITRRDSISELIEGGVAIGAAVSSELLEAIFQKLSPLHDGAAIIEGDRLLRANAVLPLTQRHDVPTFYGTRHRAAIGLAERCDALVIAVSEERAEVTLMDGRRICPMADPEQFAATLEALLSPTQESMGTRLRRVFFTNLGLKFAALGLAGVFWGMSFLAAGTTVRTISVPIEFSNVPPGMQVVSQSADTLEIQVQGNPWIIGSVSLGGPVGRFDLRNFQPGWHTLRFQQNSLHLPPGIAVVRVTPETIRVQMVPSPVQHLPENSRTGENGLRG